MPLRVQIVTAEREVFAEDAVDMVVAPGAEGVVGILPRHAPLLTTLAVGELRIREHGAEEAIFVGGGFLEVNNNVVTVLADDAERASEIDEQRAEAARRRAQELLERHDLGSDAAVAAAAELERAVGRLRVAELHRQRGGRRRELPPQELG